jgi:O-antigen/teichoic acid export membrane protein
VTDLATDSVEMRRSVAVSATTQGAARVLHLVLNVASTLIIIRYLKPSTYGDYVLVLTVSMLVGLLADFGLTKLATREVAQDPGSENEVLGTVLLARFCLAVLCIGLLQLVLLGLGVSAELHEAGFVASVLYLGNALMVSMVVFYVRIKQQYEAIIQVGMELFETAYILILVVKHASLTALFIPPTVAALLGAVVGVYLVRKRFGVRFHVALNRIPYLLKEALPLGPALMISVCYLKLDALMLVILRTPRDVGLYGSAYQPIEYVFLAAAVVVNVAFPLVAAAYAAGDHERFSHLYRRGAEVLVAAMLFVPVVLSLVAVPLVDRVYGSAYHDAARPLQVLAITLVLMTVNGWQAFVLLGGGQQRATLLYNLAALGVAAVGCLVLINAYGIEGAALATLFTSAFVLVCSTLAVRRHFDVHLAMAPLLRIVVAAAALWVALWLLQRAGTPWPAIVAAGLVLYPASLMAFGVLRPSTLTSWKKPVAAVESAPRGRHVKIDREVPPLPPILFEVEPATAGTEASR